MRRVLAVIGLTMVAPRAWACGGPDRYELYQPLTPASTLTWAWLNPDDGYETTPSDPVRFLYPLRAAHPEEYKDLWAFTYDNAQPAPTPVGTFAAAVKRGELAFIEDAARTVVKQQLDRPASLAGDDDELRAAVEFLEIMNLLPTLPKTEVQSYFSGGKPTSPVLVQASAVRGITPANAAKLLAANPKHPRKASLRLRILQGAMQSGIPDGWSAEDIRERLPKNDPLFGQVSAWLADFPGHPLADYVRLYALRLHYLHGDAKSAWKLVMTEYERHPVRAVAEMQFMVRNGLGPPAELLGPKVPGELAAALLREIPLDGATWSTWWRVAEASPKAAWSVPMQEVLLSRIVQEPPATLPEAFPAAAAAPSPTWAMLRLAALMQAKRQEDAWAQSALCTEGPVAPIRAQIELAREDYVGAVLEPGLDDESRQYLIRVMAPEPALKQLRAKGDAIVQEESRLALASRAAATGDWKAAAKLMGSAWSGVAKARKSSKGDPLKWARYLQSRRGELFVGDSYEDIVWYRSLNAAEPYHDAEIAWAKRSFEDWFALQAYATALDGATEEAVRKDPLEWQKILLEADASYNKLLNYGNGDYYLWGSMIVDSDEARRVRRAGKVIRAANR